MGAVHLELGPLPWLVHRLIKKGSLVLFPVLDLIRQVFFGVLIGLIFWVLQILLLCWIWGVRSILSSVTLRASQNFRRFPLGGLPQECPSNAAVSVLILVFSSINILVHLTK